MLKKLRVTRDHQRAMYDNVPYRFTVYDARSIGEVRQFAQSDCVEILVMNRLKIEPPRIVSQSADVEVLPTQDRLDYRVSGKPVLARLAGHGPVPNVVEMVEDLLAHVQPPIKLTRRTIAAVVTGVADRQAALNNPQEFASQAARVLRDCATHQLVDGIHYEKDGTWYDLTKRKDVRLFLKLPAWFKVPTPVEATVIHPSPFEWPPEPPDNPARVASG